MSILEVHNLSKSLKKRRIIQSVSLYLKDRQIVGLLGPNGAGKTTCFYITVGLITPDQGEVKLNGQTIDHLPMFKRAHLGMSYLPQEASIFRGLSVKENLLVALEARGDSGTYKKQQLKSLLKRFKINHIADSFGYSLSGGERRRVEIARSLVGKTQFLLLDEPFSGVDPIAVKDLQKIIKDLVKDRGIGILITDHNVRDVLGICDKVYILNDGKIIVSGTPQEVVLNPLARQLYLGESFHL